MAIFQLFFFSWVRLRTYQHPCPCCLCGLSPLVLCQPCHWAFWNEVYCPLFLCISKKECYMNRKYRIHNPHIKHNTRPSVVPWSETAWASCVPLFIVLCTHVSLEMNPSFIWKNINSESCSLSQTEWKSH